MNHFLLPFPSGLSVPNNDLAIVEQIDGSDADILVRWKDLPLRPLSIVQDTNEQYVDTMQFGVPEMTGRWKIIGFTLGTNMNRIDDEKLVFLRITDKRVILNAVATTPQPVHTDYSLRFNDAKTGFEFHNDEGVLLRSNHNYRFDFFLDLRNDQMSNDIAPHQVADCAHPDGSFKISALTEPMAPARRDHDGTSVPEVDPTYTLVAGVLLKREQLSVNFQT